MWFVYIQIKFDLNGEIKMKFDLRGEITQGHKNKNYVDEIWNALL